ncbi:integrator complex subunit 1 isoform X1 [Octopus sinensis]|uniref:Integrator complex subunit 1 isoform X1 n=1 Tax=Octopus sinensis TaxID=2607531 RepID=A0A6P7TGZ5_9MOLL|nr:integrator complex subunit 1 isoform X1 [Octopus sinensis]
MKPGSGKRGKSKALPPPGDFIALGKQSKSSSETELRVCSSSAGKKSSLSNPDRKREPGPAVPVSLAKKPKLLGATFTPLGRPSDLDKKTSSIVQVPLYEESAIEVDAADFLTEVQDAFDSDMERVDGLLCGAVKSLRANRSKPDPCLYLSLIFLVRAKPSIFLSELVTEAFCSLLKRDVSINFKAKGNPLVSVLACNILMAAYSEDDNWPDDFVKVYVEDSLGEHNWVDREECKIFVDNILTAFNTKTPTKNRLLSNIEGSKSGEQSGSSSPSLSVCEEEDKSIDSDSFKSGFWDADNSPITPRYVYQQEMIESDVLEIVREQLNKRQPMDGSTRNLIRLMTVTCGSGEIRLTAAQRLEMWLQNPKLSRSAQDLLLSVCLNCDQSSSMDVETIVQLTKIRLKTKPLINHYLSSLRELLSQNSENLRMILTQTIYNELSSARNPNNMALLGVICQSSPETSARILAEIFQDLLVNKEDYLRALRALFREIVRSLRHDLNFVAFCLGLMQKRTETKFLEMDQAFKERYVLAITDLITLTILVGITPSVREAFGNLARGDRKDLEILHQYQQQVTLIQRDSVWWLHTVVPSIVEMKPHEYVHCLHKVLFMESTEHYHNKDNWPLESDRALMLRIASEVPVLEDTLMRVLVIGLSRELSLSSADAVELADQLIKRAAMIRLEGVEVLRVTRLEFVDALMNLCAYRHPENIVLPKGYTPPTLAISALYWKAWNMLLIIVAFNPSTFGQTAWENYPILKCLMEMAMTNNYKFPPPTTATEEKHIEEIKNHEKQLYEKEKHEILEFESHLAAATSKITITESNSLLLSQLTTMDVSGSLRKPPSTVIEQLVTLNQNLKIGQRLCRSRNPDFLLDIIQRQGTTQSMPWLAELVESNEGSLDVLPVQCLCEFLLHDPQDSTEDDDADFEAEKQKKRKMKKQEQLLAKLQMLVHSPSSDSTTTFEVMDYFFKRLSSSQASSRSLAIKGLSLVVSMSHIPPSEIEPIKVDEQEEEFLKLIPQHKWLLLYLPSLPLFDSLRTQACYAIRKACRVETDPTLVSAYVIFLDRHVKDVSLQNLDDLAFEVAQLIVERTTVMSHVVPPESDRPELANRTLTAVLSLYTKYIRRAKEPDKEAYDWSNTQDQIILQWESGDSATMLVLVVHAMIILLTYGPPKDGETYYEELLKIWFPEEGSPPNAFLLDTSEEALLLPDWLKLRMIRSSIERLIDAALQDLDPAQLFLFVQSFGIPVSSMTKLLKYLDHAVKMDCLVLDQAGVDKCYLAQLIDIQHTRGAEGGHVFLKMLKENSPSTTNEEEDFAMDYEESKSSEWTPPPKTGQVTLSTEIKDMVTYLQQLFVSSPVNSNSLAAGQYQKILKSLTSSNEVALNITKALSLILNSPQQEVFVEQMLKSANKAGPLLKLLIAKQRQLQDSLRQMMEQLWSLCKGHRSPVAAVVNQYMVSYCHHSSKQQAGASEIQTVASKIFNSNKELEEDKTVSDFKKLGLEKDPLFESVVECCMKNQIKTQKMCSITKVACRMLKDNQLGLAVPSSAAWLFVDWLELIDPEVIHNAPDLQMLLLFTKQQQQQSESSSSSSKMLPSTTNDMNSVPSNYSDGHLSNSMVKESFKGRPRQQQAYLLALLTHQSHWGTLHRCISYLLQTDEHIKHDPTSVLDFLWACIHIPKLWQGQERKGQKSFTSDDVLGLRLEQICTVVDYVVQEASESCLQETEEGEDISDQKVSNDSASVINCRIELVKNCLSNSDTKLKGLVRHTEKYALSSSSLSNLYQHTLLELYLQYPYLLSWLQDTSLLLGDVQTTQKCASQLDHISHRLLSALGNALPGKAAENRMYDANNASRKLAAEHPLLILRQLPLIAALLQGKTHFTIGEMRSRNYLLLFSYVLGLLEFLEPHIFRKEHTALDDVLEAYFSLIKNHGQEYKNLSSIIVKFIQFLQRFVLHEPNRAVHILQKYIELLSVVSNYYPDLSVLKSLLAGLSLPRQLTKGTGEADETETSVTPPLVNMQTNSLWSFNQLAPFFARLSKDSPKAEILGVLQDLDEASKRKVNILDNFQADLKRLMADLNDECRSYAYTMVMRSIRQNPSNGSQYVPVLVQCLGDDSPDIVISALRNLAEFVALCQEHASVILEKAFVVGIVTAIETSSYISEALQLLNLETTQ